MHSAARREPGLLPSPKGAELQEIAANLYWARIPLDGKLNHINVWLLRDPDGYTVIDTGMDTPEARKVWQEIIASLPGGLGIKRVLVTHLHPDHIGLAGWFMEQGAEEFWMTRSEYLTCQALIYQANSAQTPDELYGFQRALGWSDEVIEAYRRHYSNYSKRIYKLPLSYRRLQEGQVHRLGGHEWKVVIGSGHSPEHACLYSEQSGLLISGDQVLAKISSNVSVTALEPEANPMVDWLDSLDKLKRSIPDSVLVLPAHQHCFGGLHARLDELHESQHAAFDRVRTALAAAPLRVVDLFGVIFGREIGLDDFLIFSLATGEALACLNYLVRTDEVEFSTDSDGVRWYQLRLA